MRAARLVRILTTVAVVVGVTATSWSAAPQEAPTETDVRAQVLVLGTFHMANPGHDIFNSEADDVLSPFRQEQMEEVVEVLRAFRPTKIAVEAGAGDERIARWYEAYLAGEHELTRNETQQLGFRLAKRLGHEAVYPVDADGEFPFPRLVKYAEATGQTEKFEALQAQVGAEVEALDAYLASHTLLETLLYMNSERYADDGVGSYFRLAEFGERWDWAGADLVADWFRRNMRIYTNIVRLVESPQERVLVIYGAGHLGWLQYAFEMNPAFRLRHLREFTP